MGLGLGSKKKPLEKPEALVLLEQCEKLHIPLVSGGLLDQPHIWILEVGQVIETRDIYTSFPASPSPAGAK